MKSFTHVKGDPASIINSNVLSLFVDGNRNLWAGTFKGVSRFDPDTETFHNYLLDPVDLNSNLANHCNAIVESTNGSLYATSEAGYIYCFDPIADQFERVNSSSLGIIKEMVVDQESQLWIGSTNAVYSYDPATKSTRQFLSQFSSPDAVSANFIEALLPIGPDEVWIGTSTHGLVILNPTNGDTRTVPPIGTGESYIHSIQRDSTGSIWVGHDSGITIHNPSTGSRTLINTVSFPGPLPPSGIQSMLIDEQGNVWAGSAQHGLYLAPLSKRFFGIPFYYSGTGSDHLPIVSSLLLDSKGQLWIGRFAGGIDVFDSEHRPIHRIRPNPHVEGSISPRSVLMISEDHMGRIWVGTYRGGLQLYDPKTQLFKTFKHNPDDPDSIAGNDIRGLVPDNDGNLWILTHGQGLTLWDQKTSKFELFRHDPLNTQHSLNDDWANCLVYTRSGRVLVGSEVGVSVFDPATRTTRNFSAQPGNHRGLRNSGINCIHEDSSNRIWVGTNDGFALFDPQSGDCNTWSTEHGLPNPVVNSIQEDMEGFLWIGTSGGLARFNPSSGNIRAYDAFDGLAGNEFYPRASARAANGTVYFGQKKGPVWFKPGEIADNTTPPLIHITGLKLLNQPLDVRTHRMDPLMPALDRSILRADSVSLDYHDKMITFEYVAISYIQPVKNRYAYRLEGFDRDWVQAGPKLEATYTISIQDDTRSA